MTPAGQLISDALAATTRRELNRVQKRAGDHKMVNVVVQTRLKKLAELGRLEAILPPSQRAGTQLELDL